MKLDGKVSLNRFVLLALAAGGSLLFFTAVGCGDDDDGAGGTGADTDAGTDAGMDGAKGTDAGRYDEAEKLAACQCWFEAGALRLERLIPACVDNISDECLVCTEDIAGDRSCSSLNKTAFDPCTADCLDLLPIPADAAECKEYNAAGSSNPDVLAMGDCMCDNCFDLYAPCVGNLACQKILMCVAEQGCIGTACVSDPVCSPVMAQAMDDDPRLLTELAPINECSAEHRCQERGGSVDASVDSGADGAVDTGADGGTDGS